MTHLKWNLPGFVCDHLPSIKEKVEVEAYGSATVEGFYNYGDARGNFITLTFDDVLIEEKTHSFPFMVRE